MITSKSADAVQFVGLIRSATEQAGGPTSQAAAAAAAAVSLDAADPVERMTNRHDRSSR